MQVCKIRVHIGKTNATRRRYGRVNYQILTQEKVSNP